MRLLWEAVLGLLTGNRRISILNFRTLRPGVLAVQKLKRGGKGMWAAYYFKNKGTGNDGKSRKNIEA